MLSLRLQRIGRKNDPHFRLVATDSKNAAQSGKAVETVGTYNVKMGIFNPNVERVKHWLSVGAKPSDTVFNLLINKGVIEGKKRNLLPSKKKEAAKK